MLFAVQQIGLELITSSPKIFQLVSLQQTFFIEIVINFNLHETSQQDHNTSRADAQLLQEQFKAATLLQTLSNWFDTTLY